MPSNSVAGPIALVLIRHVNNSILALSYSSFQILPSSTCLSAFVKIFLDLPTLYLLALV